MSEKTNDFTQGRILPKMIKFMLPILGALVLQAMYGAVDIFVVGKFGTTAGISAVNTGTNIINLVVFTVSGFTMGITVLIGKYLGEKKSENVGKVIGGAVCLFAVISVILSILLCVFARPLAILMKAPKEALDETVLYVRICGGGIIFIIAYNVISSIFRGLGDSKRPLIFVLIACVVNIVGDLILIAGFKLNVVGAAVATVFAQAVSVVLSLFIMKKIKLPFTISKTDICFNLEIKRFAIIGFPIAFQEVLTQISFLALCAFINNLGLDASSGYGVANKIVSFVMLVPGALMQSMSSFVAQNVGAGKERRSRQSMHTGMLLGCSIGVVIMLLSYFGGEMLAGIFSSDGLVIKRAGEYLKGFATEAVVTCILFSFMGYFNGHSQTLFVMLQGIAQSFIVRLPMSYIMSIQPDASLTMIGYAAPAATVFGIIINLIYYIIYTKRLNKRLLNNID